MKDPNEGLTDAGLIQTGVRRDRIQLAFAPVIDAAIEQLAQIGIIPGCEPVSLYLYGSVATGRAVVPTSDVDLLCVGVAPDSAAQISAKLSKDFKSVCRGVDIAPSITADFEGESDEAYGGRIFLKHYCLHLLGPELLTSDSAFAGDKRAARAFNGDIAQHFARWRDRISIDTPERLARTMARKSLLAIAGVVSVHDRTWSTDRVSNAMRWMQLHPQWQRDCNQLIAWSSDSSHASRQEVSAMLAPGGLVSAIVADFNLTIGLWQTQPPR